MLANASLRFLLIATAITVADGASAAQLAANDSCSLYGFAPGTHDYAACRMNTRHFWTTRPCGNSEFAAVHRRYCNIDPPFDF
jgi:hypothetical protein